MCKLPDDEDVCGGPSQSAPQFHHAFVDKVPNVQEVGSQCIFAYRRVLGWSQMQGFRAGIADGSERSTSSVKSCWTRGLALFSARAHATQ